MRSALVLSALLLLVPSAAACNGLSPGDELIADGSRCTLAFLVADANGLYFATAGHCIQVGVAATSPDVGRFGEAVFHHLEPETGSPSDGAPGEDFALIRVDPAMYDKLNPAVCGWGGPTGIYTETPGSGGVRHYGYGLLFGDVGPTTRQRQGANLYNDDNFAFYWAGAGVPGDSGSAVISDDGRALGVLTHLRVAPDTNGGTHLVRGFELAKEAGFDVRLVLEGEDPVEVLRSLQGGSPPADTTPPPATPTPADSTAEPTPEPDANQTEPEPEPEVPADDGTQSPPDALDAARTDDAKSAVPAPALPLVILVAALAALRRRT